MKDLQDYADQLSTKISMMSNKLGIALTDAVNVSVKSFQKLADAIATSASPKFKYHTKRAAVRKKWLK